MQTRHRIPTVFNLSMVDVLCCALGCVILLWLINFREAKRRAAAAGQASQQLTVTRGRLASAEEELGALKKKHAAALANLARAQDTLDSTRRELESVRQQQADTLTDLSRTRDRLTTVSRTRDQALDDLASAQAKASGLEKSLRALEATNKEASAGLQARTRENAELARKMAEAGQTLAALQKEIKARQAQLVTLNSQVDDLTGRLALASARSETLAKDVEKGKAALTDAERRIRELRAARTTLQEKLTASDKEAGRRIVELLAEKALLEQKLVLNSRDLETARQSAADLRSGNKALKEQVQLVRAAAANRFAGLELTGRKVVFLIDISGSMKMRDEHTLLPTKWPAVCQTVAKVMRSLPELSHYQVILFSKTTRYLLGREGQWLAYGGEASVKATLDALKDIDPRGGTKMTPAFAEVFRFRPLGLDTVYFFSDGLPNDDDNLPPAVAALDEPQRSAYLSKRVREALQTVWNRPEPGRPAVRINTVGFFFDSPEVGAFLWALARENDGGFVGMSRP